MDQTKGKWVVFRESRPQTGAIVALLLLRYDVRAGLWYNVYSDGTHTAEEVANMEEWKGPVPQQETS